MISKFSKVDYNSKTQPLVMFGSGLVWDDVYTALDLLGVNVVDR